MAWPANPALVAYTYERGEGRFKHRWNEDEAGFRPGDRGPIGKCHRSIDEAAALALLRSGVVPASLYEDAETQPSEVYAVYRGVPYVAVPTTPGRSFHGYPWRGRMAPSVRQALRDRARAEGHERTFDAWLREYSS